jgi:hypothetical protein
MNLTIISGKLQQLAVFFGNIIRSGIQILIWTVFAAASLAVVFVAFRAIWHAVKLALNALGI